MISLYSGTPGSGKSIHLAERLYYRLRSGKAVIANFPLKLEKVHKKKKLPFTYISNEELTPYNLIKFSYDFFKGKSIREGEILLVIDEAQILFSNRSWNDSRRPAWLSFFSQHRKYGFEIIMVAQFDGMIDRQIRSLIEYNLIHRKASNFGIGGKFISLFGLGKLFVAVKVWYPLGEKVGSEFFRAKKKFYQIYNTYYNFLEQGKQDKIVFSIESSGPAASAVSEEIADAAGLDDEIEEMQAI